MIVLEHGQFQCPANSICAASKPFGAGGAESLRRRALVVKQDIFEAHDRDEIDLVATHLAALSTYAREADHVVGI